MDLNNYYSKKYLKYKKKYLDLKKKLDLTGGYKSEYDPLIFIDILEKNNIKVTDQSDKIQYFPPTAVHTSFGKIMELIKKSCESFLEKVDISKETIMLIPMFSEQDGYATNKSNFWFSLLYLKLLIQDLKFPVKDVVLIGSSIPSQYFIDLIDEPVSFNFLLCDDGSYSGQQVINHLIPMFINKPLLYNKINAVHFCFPFCVKVCNELSPEEIELKDEIIEKKIKYTYELHGKGKYNFKKMHRAELAAVDRLNKEYKDEDKSLKIIYNISRKGYLQYFGEFIKFHVGDKNFNKEMNHWFDHKIPDGKSFVSPHRPDISIQKMVEVPYKIKWKIFGREVTDEIRDKLPHYKNKNKLLIDPNYIENINANILSLDELDYLPNEITSKLGAYFKKIEELEKKYMEENGIE